MDAELVNALAVAGMNEREAQVYLAILKSGEKGISEIAETTGLGRTGLYAVLEHMKERGFVREVLGKEKSSYVAEPPEHVLERTTERLDDVKHRLKDVGRVLEKAAIPHIEVLEGSEGFKHIWDTLLTSGEKEYLIITDADQMNGFVREQYITGKIIEEKVRLGIRSRQLITNSIHAKEIVAKDKKENRVSKLMPHTAKMHVTKIIFGHTVAIIGPATENIIVVVESKAFANTERVIFELLWEGGSLK